MLGAGDVDMETFYFDLSIRKKGSQGTGGEREKENNKRKKDRPLGRQTQRNREMVK